MKPYSIFIEDLKADKEEFNALADYDMGNSTINRRVSDLEVAHGMALTTVSFEFECLLNIKNEYLKMLDADIKYFFTKTHIESLYNDKVLVKLDDEFNEDSLLTFLNYCSIPDEYIDKGIITWDGLFEYVIQQEKHNSVDLSKSPKQKIQYLLNRFKTKEQVIDWLKIIPPELFSKKYNSIFNYNKLKKIHKYRILTHVLGDLYNTSNIVAYDTHSSKNNEFKINNPDYWFVEPDLSIKKYVSDGTSDYLPIEIISPWIPAKDAVKFVTKFRNGMQKAFQIKTNLSTSLHCSFRTHITDRDNKFPLKLNVLKLLALLDEDEHLDRFGRKDNEYTQPIQSKLKDIAVVNPINPINVNKAIKQLENLLKNNDKYNAINFTDFLTNYNVKTGNGRMEIRIIGDDYMGTLFNKAMYSLNEFILLISSALDNDLHKDEFQQQLDKKANRSPEFYTIRKKLINLFNDFIKKEENIVNKDDILPLATTTIEKALTLLSSIKTIDELSELFMKDAKESVVFYIMGKHYPTVNVQHIIQNFIDKHPQNKILQNLISNQI